MTFNEFREIIRRYDKAGLQPDEATAKRLKTFYWRLIERHSDPLGPNSLDMVHRVLFNDDTVDTTREIIAKIERHIEIARGLAPPFDFPELSPRVPPLNSKSEAEIAKQYFETGLRLGKVLGALTDPLRAKTKLHQRQRQEHVKSKAYWAPHSEAINTLVADRVAGRISTNAALRTGIQALDSRNLKPAESTVSRWIANYKANGHITKGIVRARLRSNGQQ